ncbi:MAG: agmatine deiminase family protein [Spirochaetota bacterium]
MLLVLSAPSVYDRYYSKALQKIVDFQIHYAKKIIGHDNVIILVDEDTKSYYSGKVPEDILLTTEVYDIWMRDFTTINPMKPIQFTYTWASMSKKRSRAVQKSFTDFANKYKIQRSKTKYILDGGNIVDDYRGKVITTKRFLKDNRLSYAKGKRVLQKLLHAKQVAILEPDDEILAHSDGMVMWLEGNKLLVNDYHQFPQLKKKVLRELKTSFPDSQIIQVPVSYADNKLGEWDGIESACGVNLNSVVTYNYIYVPVFKMKHDKKALAIIKSHTQKTVIPIQARNVCPMGGSVRCLTWQVIGENAKRLILQARK